MSSVNREFHVRDILAMSLSERRETLPDGGVYLTFDDGTRLGCKTRNTIYSAYYWDMLKMWPGGKINPEHHIGNGYYNTGTHSNVGHKVFWECFDNHQPDNHELIWPMSKFYYETTNEIYNDVIREIPEFSGTVDLDEAMDVIMHPMVVEYKKLFSAGKLSLTETGNKIFKLFLDPKDEVMNRSHLARAVRAGLNGQRVINQLIGPRGYVSDSNNKSFPSLIEPGYIEGLDTAYDCEIESRTAATALYMAEDPLKASEYNNRMCQLLCGSIRGIKYGDCGTTDTIPWLVSKKNLRSLVGKYFIDDNGELDYVRETSTHLIGKFIKIRSITKCRHEDAGVPCSTCLGRVALVVPPGTSPGTFITISPLGAISQTILSTKHIVSSTAALKMDINGKDSRYIKLSEVDDFEVLLLPPAKGHTRRLKFALNDAKFLNDINSVDQVEELNHEDISNIQNLFIDDYDDTGKHVSTVNISTRVGSDGTPFNHNFLQYIREHGTDIDGKYYTVVLNEWDYDKSFMRTRRVGEDIMTTLRSFTDFMSSDSESSRKTTNFVSVTQFTEVGPAIAALFDLLNKKLAGKINFAHVEVFVRALMCVPDGYRLPVGGEPFVFGRLKQIIERRSVPAAFAFQNQNKLIEKSSTYCNDEPPTPHSMDGLWDLNVGD